MPWNRLPDHEMSPDVAYQLIHDELMIDGNARLNVVMFFVTTWMEEQASRLMTECFDKNMIDKDEYPQTAELEMRCVNILSRLWNAPETSEATGCSTIGSSEAAMLGRPRPEAPVAAAPPCRGESRPRNRTWSWASTSRSAGRSSPTTGTSR